MKIKDIAFALNSATAWCLNRWVAPPMTRCVDVVGCPFKNGEKRPATARELYKCRMFRLVEKIPARQDKR